MCVPPESDISSDDVICSLEETDEEILGLGMSSKAHYTQSLLLSLVGHSLVLVIFDYRIKSPFIIIGL